jgi:arylsulfatase B/arylsulfatase I/J
MNARFQFILCAFLIAIVQGSIDAKPNVILYVVDDLGFADLSLTNTAKRTAGGYARDHSTPNIDMLAGEGVLLDSYYVNRLCSPTRTSLISSRYAYNIGLAGGVITNGFPVALRLNETSIAEHMKAVGYQTHAFGKWDCGYHTWKHTPTERGFDTWLGYYNADEDYNTHSCGGGGCKDKSGHPSKFLDLRNDTNVLEDNSTYSTILYTSEAVRMIKHHDPAQGPFFLYAAYQAVHGPLEAPQKYLDQCDHVSGLQVQYLI